MATEAVQHEHGVLHLIGRDRVGILQDASAFVSERGGMVEEGISHTLSNEAVVLLYITGSPEDIRSIEHDAAQFGKSLQLLTLFTKIKVPETAREREALPLTLRLSSPKLAQLLGVMTKFFSKHGLRIVAHHVHKSTVPYSQGLTTYRHKFTVLLPSEFNRKNFIAGLDELAREADFIRDDISLSDFY